MAKKTKSAKRAARPSVVRRSRGVKRAKSSKGVATAVRRGRGVSIHIGLNAVSPSHYEGWSGELQACEFDAKDMAALARAAGITPTILLTKNATRARVTALPPKTPTDSRPRMVPAMSCVLAR